MSEISNVNELYAAALDGVPKFSNHYGQIIRVFGDRLLLGWDPLSEIWFDDGVWHWKLSERGSLGDECTYEEATKLIHDIREHFPKKRY